MAKRIIQLGPTGHQVAENIHELRRHRGLTLVELAERVAEQGRELPGPSIGQIEAKQRRVDVDDLAAIAAALGTPVGPLLERHSQVLVPVTSDAALRYAGYRDMTESAQHEIRDEIERELGLSEIRSRLERLETLRRGDSNG